MKSLSGHDIKYLEEFKYIYSYIGSTQHNVGVRIGSLWAPLYNLNRIWIVNLSNKQKNNVFKATVEIICIWLYYLDFNINISENS